MIQITMDISLLQLHCFIFGKMFLHLPGRPRVFVVLANSYYCCCHAKQSGLTSIFCILYHEWAQEQRTLWTDSSIIGILTLNKTSHKIMRPDSLAGQCDRSSLIAQTAGTTNIFMRPLFWGFQASKDVSLSFSPGWSTVAPPMLAFLYCFSQIGMEWERNPPWVFLQCIWSEKPCYQATKMTWSIVGKHGVWGNNCCCSWRK